MGYSEDEIMQRNKLRSREWRDSPVQVCLGLPNKFTNEMQESRDGVAFHIPIEGGEEEEEEEGKEGRGGEGVVETEQQSAKKCKFLVVLKNPKTK